LFNSKSLKYLYWNLASVIEKLKKLGLTGYEAQAYLALLKLGDAGADEIASAAKIPMGRIYNVLSNLEEYRLIRAQDTRPRKYVCVEPASAMERLLKNKQEVLKHEASELEKLSSDLAAELSGVRGEQHAKSFWTVAIGDESHELYSECILGAKKEVLFFMASRITSERVKSKVMKGKYSGIISALNEALHKGVEVKAILSRDVDFCILEEHPEIKKLLMHMRERFNCRLAEIPSTPFDIIDGENVLLKMLNPVNPNELFAVVNIRDTKLAEELRKKFAAIWEKAEGYSSGGC
jgi:sugar-specific transcriptional regulator TrmB